ncbi:MAG: GNAT family N-acetyltransferase [Rhodobacteraceae bacterium]|nr:GNAT family N-acetyltransferase [Paracoccaceae bacterium]MAY46789.1 GNAT family N-acetyltransferase [Paracoccaceae bacterium]
MTGVTIRQARESDHDALLDICLKTALHGEDATATEDDPNLVGLIFAVPYQVFAPEHAFVLEDADGVCGYVLGAPDSRAFYDWQHNDWFARLRPGLKDPGTDESTWTGSDRARAHILRPPAMPAIDLARFPAHGHIDLLPRAQGGGMGRAAIFTLMRSLHDTGAPGLHLGVSPRNANALGFYRHLGFRDSGVGGKDEAVMTIALDDL